MRADTTVESRIKDVNAIEWETWFRDFSSRLGATTYCWLRNIVVQVELAEWRQVFSFKWRQFVKSASRVGDFQNAKNSFKRRKVRHKWHLISALMESEQILIYVYTPFMDVDEIAERRISRSYLYCFWYLVSKRKNFKVIYRYFFQENWFYVTYNNCMFE